MGYKCNGSVDANGKHTPCERTDIWWIGWGLAFCPDHCQQGRRTPMSLFPREAYVEGGDR